MQNLILTKNEKKALLEFKTALENKFGPRLIMLQLFGSKARGDFHKYSDLDIIVVVKKLTKDENGWIWEISFNLSSEEMFLSPLTFTYNNWKKLQENHFSLARNVKEEGIKL